MGQASALKLACNAWIAMLTAGTAQSLGIAASLGVDPSLFLQVIEGGAVDTPYAHVKGDAMLAGDWTTSFAVDGLRKDMDLMVEATREDGFPQEMLTSVLGLFDNVSEQGHGSEDIAAVRTAFPTR
ncbi:MAG: NAD-binding protein [Marmoricola sp.]